MKCYSWIRWWWLAPRTVDSLDQQNVTGHHKLLVWYLVVLSETLHPKDMGPYIPIMFIWFYLTEEALLPNVSKQQSRFQHNRIIVYWDMGYTKCARHVMRRLPHLRRPWALNLSCSSGAAQCPAGQTGWTGQHPGVNVKLCEWDQGVFGKGNSETLFWINKAEKKMPLTSMLVQNRTREWFSGGERNNVSGSKV